MTLAAFGYGVFSLASRAWPLRQGRAQHRLRRCGDPRIVARPCPCHVENSWPPLLEPGAEPLPRRLRRELVEIEMERRLPGPGCLVEGEERAASQGAVG